MVESLETIADRLRDAGAIFSIHQPPLTSLSYIQPITQSILDDITRMTTVRELFLGGSAVTDVDVESVVRMPELVWLELSDTRISNRAIEHVADHTQLETLMLFGTAITDDCIPAIERMANLKEVGLDDTQITESGLQRLRDARPDIIIG
jgi:deoxyhypusine synthase